MAASRAKVVLGDTEIANIVNQRQTKYALKTLAATYGCGQARIRDIWTEYYGGTRLVDAVNGPIKPLPGMARVGGVIQPTAEGDTDSVVDMGPPKRRAGKFVVEAPPPYVPAASASKVVRAVFPKVEPEAPAPKAPKGGGAAPKEAAPAVAKVELEIGSIEAGNNSGDLADDVRSRLRTLAVSGTLPPKKVEALAAEAEQAIQKNEAADQAEPEVDNYEASDYSAPEYTAPPKGKSAARNAPKPAAPKQAATRRWAPPQPDAEGAAEEGSWVDPGHNWEVSGQGGASADPSDCGSGDGGWERVRGEAESEISGRGVSERGRTEAGGSSYRSRGSGSRASTASGGSRAGAVRSGAGGSAAASPRGGEAGSAAGPVRTSYWPIPSDGGGEGLYGEDDEYLPRGVRGEPELREADLRVGAGGDRRSGGPYGPGGLDRYGAERPGAYGLYGERQTGQQFVAGPAGGLLPGLDSRSSGSWGASVPQRAYAPAPRRSSVRIPPRPA